MKNTGIIVLLFCVLCGLVMAMSFRSNHPTSESVYKTKIEAYNRIYGKTLGEFAYSCDNNDGHLVLRQDNGIYCLIKKGN